MVYLILHKFAKLAKFAEFAIVLANSSLASTTKGHSLANSSLASLKDFRKWPFWRVLEFDKFAGEWPLLTKKPNSTEISSIRHRNNGQNLFKVQKCFISRVCNIALVCIE